MKHAGAIAGSVLAALGVRRASGVCTGPLPPPFPYLFKQRERPPGKAYSAALVAIGDIADAKYYHHKKTVAHYAAMPLMKSHRAGAGK